ncbi:MAG: hypothetical protein ACR2P5_07955 [Gammaproteobacteria bacterium]
MTVFEETMTLLSFEAMALLSFVSFKETMALFSLVLTFLCVAGLATLQNHGTRARFLIPRDEQKSNDPAQRYTAAALALAIALLFWYWIFFVYHGIINRTTLLVVPAIGMVLYYSIYWAGHLFVLISNKHWIFGQFGWTLLLTWWIFYRLLS